jgi:hypothetical protein
VCLFDTDVFVVPLPAGHRFRRLPSSLPHTNGPKHIRAASHGQPEKNSKTNSVLRGAPPGSLGPCFRMPVARAMAGDHATQINNAVRIHRHSFFLAKSILTP